MPALRMETEFVRGVGNQLEQTASTLQQQVQQLTYLVQTLAHTWQGPSAAIFTNEIQTVLQQLNHVVHTGELLNLRLHREVEEWEQVASQFGGGASALWQATILASTGGGQTSWLPAFFPDLSISLPSLSVVSLLGDWAAQWPDWLKELLAPFLAFLQPPTPPTLSTPLSPPSPGQTTFEDLLGNSLPESPMETVTPSPEQAAAAQFTNGYPVPVKSQGTLGGSAACAPTSVSMILDYYHNQNPQNRTATAQELLEMLDEGDFTYGKGMSLNDITDELQELGYYNVTVKLDATLADLQAQLQEGPVIAIVRLDMKSGQLTAAGSVVHAVVVKGLSADGQTVFINDPWVGKEVRLSKDDFVATWQKGQSGLYAIRP